MVLAVGFSTAQNEGDVIRYSNIDFGGTARYMGMGGAFGAVGADFSTLSTNPAGIGLYSKSEFMMTPSIFVNNTESKHYDKLIGDEKYNFNMANIGAVFTIPLRSNRLNDENPSGWQNVNFGFGYNRLANFHQNLYVEGANPDNSLLDALALRSFGKPSTDLDAVSSLAWETYLLNPKPSSGSFLEYQGIINNGGVLQRKFKETRGAMNEITMTLGGNYADKLYVGATFGFPIVNYDETSSYSEKDHMDTISGFKEFYYNEDLAINGAGFNFKFGLIYRPINFIRVGASIQTPSFIALEDNYYIDMKSDLDTASYFYDFDYYPFSYKINTPFRATGSIAFLFGKYGLISADYEYVDYSKAKIRSSDDPFFDVNEYVRYNFVQTNNIRLGGEINLSPFQLRGGFALYGNPFESQVNNIERTSISGGIGYREKAYFFDVAYVLSSWKQDYYMYSKDITEPANLSVQTHNVLATIGFRF